MSRSLATHPLSYRTPPRRRTPLRCPCGLEVMTLGQLVEHQRAHGIGERTPASFVRDDVSAYDEDAFKRADL